MSGLGKYCLVLIGLMVFSTQLLTLSILVAYFSYIIFFQRIIYYFQEKLCFFISFCIYLSDNLIYDLTFSLNFVGWGLVSKMTVLVNFLNPQLELKSCQWVENDSLARQINLNTAGRIRKDILTDTGPYIGRRGIN